MNIKTRQVEIAVEILTLYLEKNTTKQQQNKKKNTKFTDHFQNLDEIFNFNNFFFFFFNNYYY